MLNGAGSIHAGGCRLPASLATADRAGLVHAGWLQIDRLAGSGSGGIDPCKRLQVDRCAEWSGLDPCRRLQGDCIASVIITALVVSPTFPTSILYALHVGA